MATSKPAASPKQQIVLFLLWITSLVFLIQVMNNGRPKSDTPSATVLQNLKNQNEKQLDVSAATTFHQIQSVADREVGEKKLTAEAARDLKIQAVILASEARLRAGIDRNETWRVREAYQLLWPFQKGNLDKPEWKEKAYAVKDVSADSRFGWKEWSGQALFVKTSEVLSERNKKELIWGVLPGGYGFIDSLVAVTGRSGAFSYAFAAFLLALVVRAVVFPFSQKQLMWSRQMSQLTPLINDIKEKYKDNAQEQQARVMKLYQEYGINPMAGCAPALVQMPLFLTVYQCMLLYQFEFQKGTFLWINPTLSKATSGFIAPNLGAQDTIMIVVYGISMVVSTLLAPVSDPSNAKQQRMIGVVISVVFTGFMFTGAFPVVGGFVLYWTFTNFLAMAQSLRAYRLPMPPLVKVNAAGGGVLPKEPTTFWGKLMEQAQEQARMADQQKIDPSKSDDKGKSQDNGKSQNNGRSGEKNQDKPKKPPRPGQSKPKKGN